jgi:small-conductance mechanosensitive channel
MGNSALGIAKSLLTVGLAAVTLLAAAAGLSFGQASPAPPASAVISPAEVAAKSSEVANLLASFSDKFVPSPEIERVQRSFSDVSRQIELDFTDTSVMLGEQLSLTTLQAQQVAWQRRHLQVSTWLTLITQRAVELRGAIDRLSHTRETWIQTRDAAQAEQAPAAILKQIQTTLASIEAAQMTWKTREQQLLALQGELAGELTRCEEALTQIAKFQKSAVVGILAQESPPIWNFGVWDQARRVLPIRLADLSRGLWLNVKEYLRDPSLGMPLHATLFALLAVAACAARSKKRRWTAIGLGVSAAVKVFDRPYSAALMVVLLVSTAVISPTPARVKDILSALALVPMIRLVRPAIDPRLIPGVFAAAVLYVSDLIRQILGGVLLAGQALLVLESLAAIAVLRWLADAERLQLAIGQSSESVRGRSARVLAKVIIFLLAAGFIAAASGYTRLARLITPAIISGSLLALSLYALVRTLSGTAAIAQRAWPLQRLQMVLNHCDRIERGVFRVLKWAAVTAWAVRSLDYIGLLSPVASAGSSILNMRLERGTINISIEDILAFGLTVWASFLLSSFIRFILQEEVYPRARIPSGTAYASSRLIHYAILSLGLVVGMGVLGMDLSRVTVLAGAFGVGIGFGLQDVVNNFVCGLILLFERPVHVGDIVEVGSLQGEVRKIGIRASTVHTYQGSDIVVPNSQFITANVTNWTLSDQLRRIDLPVGVNYASAPKRVIEVLESVARTTPGILEKPPPKCLFTGYGDSSINFELRAWTDQFNNWRAIRSELASGVYDAVQAAGMSFPFPQREVRILGGSKA